ncbi:ABC transporter permease [Paenibacillus sp. MBLB4367]|uniref:ABC transporter permease n=1 Tax=Paenibacillus sp. MBLB4367 TaxID=3384767 RepID=UPI0039081E0A
MQAYLYVMKMRILTSLAYRFEVFATIGTNLFLLLATIFLWKSAYSGIPSVESLNQNQMVTYAILSSLLAGLFTCNVDNMINQRIREGQVAIDLIKPIRLLGYYLAEDIGSSVSSLLNKVLPLFVFSAIFFQLPVPASFTAFLLFVVSCALSFSILWLLSALTGLTAFWVMELGNMGNVKDAFVRVLSGSLVPMWFFPQSVQTVSAFLPFQYTYQTPLGIYIGKLSQTEALRALGIQAVWVLLFAALVAVVWRKAKRSTMIQGG